MRAVFKIYTGEDFVDACDEYCYNAIAPAGICCCGGLNRGEGYEAAQVRTLYGGRQILRAFAKAHPELKGLTLRTEHETFGPLNQWG